MNKVNQYFITLSLVVLSFFIGLNTSQNGKLSQLPVSGFNSSSQDCCEDLNMKRFNEVWNTIRNSYLNFDTIEKQKAMDGLIKGFVSSLGDPHSEYYTKEESKIFLSSLDSELEGIGAELNSYDGLIKVVSPIKGSPAEKAGIKSGDIIVSVDGEDIRGGDIYEVISKIKGKKGTWVRIGILKSEEESYENKKEIRIRRDVIELPSIYTELVGDDQIYYLAINQFSNDTEKEFKEKINDILVQNPKGLIIDVRFNGGGYLNTAIGVLEELIDSGQKIVNIEHASASLEGQIKANGKSRLVDIPLVILVNQGSASASEILAGAVQDNNRGIIVGTQTYGKGTVQELIPFSDGSTLRITVSKWLTPLGTDIDLSGIKPDVFVEFTEEDIEQKKDVQLERAIEILLAETSN